MKKLNVAAAVALVLGSATLAHAAAPTIDQCAASTTQLYVAGSSAAQPAIEQALAATIFGSTANMLVFLSPSGTNFQAFCGTTVNANAGPAAGSVVVVHYRGEGGSVVGALPIVSGLPIKFLDLSAVTTTTAGTDKFGATTATVTTITGVSSTVGTTDGFGGPLTQHLVELGITDVEPAQLISPNYPKDYSTAVFGAATPNQLAGLARRPLFAQVFGLFVNKNGLTLDADGTISLTKESAANILSGNYKDWGKVPTANNVQLAPVGTNITVVNREEGSGTRTGAGLFFLGTNCGSPANTGSQIVDPTGATNYFSTGDEITAIAANAGNIGYASIDNAGKNANVVLVKINGVTPTNLAAALGTYDWWYEAQLITGGSNGGTANTLKTYLINNVPLLANAPNLSDILAIPGAPQGVAVRNVATWPLTSNTSSVAGSATIYINPFTRSGNSCKNPSSSNL